MAARNWSPDTRGRSSCHIIIGPRGTSRSQLLHLRDLRTSLLVLDHLTIRMLICTDHALFTADRVPLPIVRDISAHFDTCSIKRKQNNADVKAKRAKRENRSLDPHDLKNVRPVKSVQPTALK